MSNPPPLSSPDRISLLIDLPIRLYTALRTMRLYPDSKPLVQHSNDFFLKAFMALLESGVEESINIAFSDQKILICGEPLPDKDQARPQIQGLLILFNRLKIHAFTFQPTFSKDDCVKFIQILSQFLSKKVLSEPISTLLDKAEIYSISVDANRDVAIHEGAQEVIREELLSSGLSLSDEELANFAQEKPGRNGQENSPLVTTADKLSVPIDAEAEIFTIAAQGNRNQAIKKLLELIISTARAGDFQTAERLRERIYEIDSLALNEIIRSGEIIEQEKKGAINEDDLATWSALTDRLSSEEFSTMYHEFTERRYKPEETIVNQGDKNDTLFFIAQGSIKVSHRVGPREIFITSLNRGQIAGENFFTPSFWTVSLTSLTPCKVYILQQTTLNGWQEIFPGLRFKLHEFYLACNTVQSILKKKGLDRRKDQRFNLSRKIQAQPITNLDAPIGRGFRAEIIDIAVGGLAFLIRISRQENIRLLLGRRLQVVLPIGGANKFLYLNGLVVSIQPFKILENDFSIHFKFDHSLEQQVLQTILG